MLEKFKVLYGKYNIPADNKYDSFALSINKLSVIFKAMFIFCIFEILLTLISPQMEQEMGGDIRIYYILFAGFMFVGTFVTEYWKKHKGKNKDLEMRVAKIVFICTALFFAWLTLYEALTFDNPHNVIAICVIIAFAILFIVDINPIFYSSILFIIVTCSTPHLYQVYDNVSMIVNSYLFVIVASYAPYVFQTKEITRLKTEKALREYTEHIEHQVQIETSKRTQLQDDIIYSMADLVENRDIDTGAHIKRTALFVEIIAKKARELG